MGALMGENMVQINESTLTKGQLRKLNALRKSIGDKIAEEAFFKWLKTQNSKKSVQKVDPVVEKLGELLKPIASKNVNLGTYGYTIKRARGKASKGLIIVKNIKPT